MADATAAAAADAGGEPAKRGRGRPRKLKQVDSKTFSTPAESGTEELNSSTDDEQSPAGQSSDHSRGPNIDNTLKNAIEKQIAVSMRSSSLIKCIADDVYNVIAAEFEERVTENVYQAVSMDLKKYADEVGALKWKITEIKKEMKMMQDEKENAEQYSRRNCLRIYGIPEGPREKTDELVLDVFNKKLGLTVQRDAIDRSHRISPRLRQDTPVQDRESSTSASYADATRRSKPIARPIIVKFSRYNVRSDVYRARTRLKDVVGPLIFIKEDLTAKRASLFWELVKSKKSKSCWTQDGNIFALRTRDSSKIIIKTTQDIEDL